MKASIVELRRKTAEILQALERGEHVKILYRGKEKAVLVPSSEAGRKDMRVEDHPAFGMWEDREDVRDVEAFVDRLRAGRTDDL